MKLKYILMSLLLLFSKPALASNEAEVFAKDMMDRSLKMLNDKALSDSKKNEICSELLRNNMDGPWMAKFVLGKHRRIISSTQREEFEKTYIDFVTNYFSKHFVELKEGRIDIKSSKEVSDNEYVVDCMAVMPSNDKENLIKIMIRKKENKFLVFDFVLSGISFISSQRAEYNDIISNKGIEFMTNHLKSSSNISSFEQKTNVEIYTADYCPHCKTAKDFLKQHNIRFKEIDVSKDAVARQHISELSNIKTVPQIFVNGKFVSDASGLLELKKQGKLEEVFFGSK